MKVTALLLERPLERLEAAIRRTAPDRRRRLHLGHVMLEDLEIVEAAERILHALERAHERRRLRRAAIGGEFEGVTKLLRGNADAMQTLRGVNMTSVFHGGLKSPPALDQAGSERLAPRFGIAIGKRDADGLQPPTEFRRVHGIQSLEHQRAPTIALENHVRSNIFERVARDARPPHQLIHDMERHVEFAHRAEGPRQPTDLVSRLPGLGSLDPCGQDRDGLPEPSGSHPSLVHTPVIPPDGRGQIPLQCPGSACQ